MSDGAAMIGLTSKYAAPATVTGVWTSAAGVSVLLAEGGELVGYSEKKVKRVAVGDRECEFDQKDGWLTVQVPNEQDVCVWIEW